VKVTAANICRNVHILIQLINTFLVIKLVESVMQLNIEEWNIILFLFTPYLFMYLQITTCITVCIISLLISKQQGKAIGNRSEEIKFMHCCNSEVSGIPNFCTGNTVLPL
jgi:hypothetical protein